LSALAAAMASVDCASERTGAMMSMMGLAGRPGTAVLPMCSTGPASQGASAVSKRLRSASNRVGHAGSYSTTSIGASSVFEAAGVFMVLPVRGDHLRGSRRATLGTSRASASSAHHTPP